jgi:SAM-dependent methyltransferase
MTSRTTIPVGHPLLRRARWLKRLHARLHAIGNASYERAVAGRKRELFGALRGVVVEIGAAAGANLEHFDRGIRYVAVEPNAFAHDFLRERAGAIGLDASLHVGAAERLPLADASADAVVCSLVLCTVNDVAAALAEVRRVLKPGGVFAFVEHVAAPAGSGTRALQRAFRAPWMLIGDGCRPDRDTASAIRAAGFSSVEIAHWEAPLPAIVRPHISGVAVR